jgi:hypothetical protein
MARVMLMLCVALSLALPLSVFGVESSPYDAFVGKWEGQWVTRNSGMVDTTLTVLSIDPQQKMAKIVYTRGGTVATGARDPVSRTGVGTFKDETTLVAGTVTYKLENGVLKATQVNSTGGNWTGVLKRTGDTGTAPGK